MQPTQPVQEAQELFRALAAEVRDGYALRHVLRNLTPEERDALRGILRRCRRERDLWDDAS